MLFIDCEIMHACHILCVCVLGLAEDLEARVLKSSPQSKFPGNTLRAKARKKAEGGR